MAITFGGIVAGVPADGSAEVAVPFGTTLTGTPIVSLTLLNPTTWEGYSLTPNLIGPPTTTGFNVLVTGGPGGATISISWQVTAPGTASNVPATSTGTVPQGRSGLQAIQDVRDNCDEYTLPASTTVLRLLNRAIEEVERQLNGIFLWTAYPTVPLQTFIQLNDDIQYIESASFSSGASNTSGFISTSSPLAQGSLVYPMVQLEQGTFMDAAAGFPAVGFGPPQAFFIYTDQGTAPSSTLPVPGTPTLSPTAGTSTGAAVSVVQTYVNVNGETTPSAAAALTPDTVQQALALSPQGVSNASGYNTYVSVSSGPYYLQNPTPTALGTPYTIPSTPLTSGATPPNLNTAVGSGTGGAMFMQLYPAAMIGQVNVYYRARPLQWADTTANSWTNLDTSIQEAVILYATVLTLRNRARYDDAKDWLADFLRMIESLKESAMRRTRPKSGRVRDVTNRSFPDAPWFV
jgi:hypothetical protein